MIEHCITVHNGIPKALRMSMLKPKAVETYCVVAFTNRCGDDLVSAGLIDAETGWASFLSDDSNFMLEVEHHMTITNNCTRHEWIHLKLRDSSDVNKEFRC